MHTDIVDWGYLKIEGKMADMYTGNKKALPNLVDILSNTTEPEV